jgi:hypothetical protein
MDSEEEAYRKPRKKSTSILNLIKSKASWEKRTYSDLPINRWRRG